MVNWFCTIFLFQGKFKLIYDFLRNTIECITPSTLKLLFLWIFQFVMLVLTIFYDIIIWLCPCTNTVTLWTSNQFKNLIGHFEKKYDTITDENFEEDEKEFSWWTKYYGFKYQKVHIVRYISYKTFSIIISFIRYLKIFIRIYIWIYSFY